MRKILIVMAIVLPMNLEAGWSQYKEGYQSGWVSAHFAEGKSKPIRPSTPLMPARRANDKRPDVVRGYADGFSDGKEEMKK